MRPGPQDLLELAEHLSQREAGRPKQVSLRRAVSTAYYAVFHSLAHICAHELIGDSKPWNVYTPIYRLLDHGTAKRYFKRSDTAAALSPIGNTFILLQEARHAADYDPEPSFGRHQVRELCAQARFAVDTLGALSPEAKLFLAVGLIGKAR